jgi:hypothetical protein
MNWKKHLSLVIGGAICVVLLVAAVALFVIEQRHFAAAAGELKTAKDKLAKLDGRAPFPSPPNVEAVRTNLTQIQGTFEQLGAELAKGQVGSQAIEPAQFQNVLEGTLGQLRAITSSPTNIKLPPQFAFGFDRYAQGELPTTSTVARLVKQLRMVEALVRLLIDAQVSSIEGVSREQFDSAAAEGFGGPAAAGGMPVMMSGMGEVPGFAAEQTQLIPPAPASDLYSVERFQMAFTAKEGVVLQVLNALARHAGSLVVVNVRLLNELGTDAKTAALKFSTPALGPVGGGPAAGAAGGAAAQAAVSLAMATRDERTVSGKEMVRAMLVVDYYQFSGPAAKEGSK